MILLDNEGCFRKRSGLELRGKQNYRVWCKYSFVFQIPNPDIDHTNKPKFYIIEMQSMTRHSVTGPEKINYLSEKECSES